MRWLLVLALLASPAHAGPPPIPETPAGARFLVEGRARALTLMCADHPVIAKVSLTLYGAADGLRVTTDTPGGFAACFAAHASDPSFHARFAFATFLDLELPSLDSIAAQELAWMSVPEDCIPRPGALVDEATIEISDGALHVETLPANDEVNKCMTRIIGQVQAKLLRARGLHASITKKVERRFASGHFVSGFAQTVEKIVYDCPYDPKAPTATVTVTAPREATAFTISTKPSRGKLAACIQQRLSAALVEKFTVDGYFRIDADVNATQPVHCGNNVCSWGVAR